ncbi:MAG: hypothetical protein LWW81_01180 [Rhodocyclales bacterium]|nr:hypothetical protein [Rhodocyclales bacterium]
MSVLTVKFAVYGGLAGGNENSSQAIDATAVLQNQIDLNQGIVTIDNSSMGTDPSVGNQKYFGAIVSLNNVDRYFACQEGQTIDFFHNKQPDGTS